MKRETEKGVDKKPCTVCAIRNRPKMKGTSLLAYAFFGDNDVSAGNKKMM